MYADRDWGASGRVLTVVGFAVLMATLTVVNIGDSGVLQDLLLRRRHPDRPRGGERGDP